MRLFPDQRPEQVRQSAQQVFVDTILRGTSGSADVPYRVRSTTESHRDSAAGSVDGRLRSLRSTPDTTVRRPRTP